MSEEQHRDEQPKETDSNENPSSSPLPAEQKDKIDEMEKGIDRVGDHIDEAKEEAEHAETLDPRPITGDEGGLNSTD